MKLPILFVILLFLQVPGTVHASNPIVDALLQQYQAQGASTPNGPLEVNARCRRNPIFFYTSATRLFFRSIS